MTREEFNDEVLKSYLEYKADMLTLSPAELFERSYEIAKCTSIKDYLTETEDFRAEAAYPYASVILEDLYDFEFNYDTAQWANWDDMDHVLEEYIIEKEREKHEKGKI